MARSVVLLTAMGTNNWSARRNSIVECNSEAEADRLVAGQLARELNDDEPKSDQKVFRMADAVTAPEATKAASEATIPPVKSTKAANADDAIDDDVDGDPLRSGQRAVFDGASELGWSVFKFAGGYYNVVDADGNLRNAAKLRKGAVEEMIARALDPDEADETADDGEDGDED